MSRWEYMTFDCTQPKDDVEGLDELGDEGWKAVAMVLLRRQQAAS